ncbi:MAG: TIGR02652 family protein [Cyanobacteria bacterium P01_C01_bin.89]
MLNSASQYPIFGPEIQCPHCRQAIAALTLTDTYLCQRHGAFEANPDTRDLVHLQSNRCWREWEGEWYRQHTHPDGIRFEIHEALDRLYTEGFRATQIVVARRYKPLISAYLERYNRQVMATQSLYSDAPSFERSDSRANRKELSAKEAAGKPSQKPGDHHNSTSKDKDSSSSPLRLYGLPVTFNHDENDPRWGVINFALEKEVGLPARYPYFRMFE